jgi:ABC-2 type transport system permease protein
VNGTRLYWRYARINARALLEYRMWPMQVLASMLTTVWDFFAVVVLYLRFGALGAWTVGHTLLAFGLGATSFGLAELFSRGLDLFPWYVAHGAFDRILLRPRSTILQTLGERFQLDRGGRVAVGLACIAMGLRLVEVRPDIFDLAMILSALAGGWLLYTGVFTVFAAVAFWTIGPIQIVYMFTNHTLQYLKIPFGYFGVAIRRLLVFVFPLALCTYFPVMSLTGISDRYVLGFAALPAGAVFCALSLLFWRYGVQHYHSTGS